MTITDIDDARVSKWSKEFATIYLEEGERAAVLWAQEEVPESYYDAMAPGIRSYLEQKGCNFHDKS